MGAHGSPNANSSAHSASPAPSADAAHAEDASQNAAAALRAREAAQRASGGSAEAPRADEVSLRKRIRVKTAPSTAAQLTDDDEALRAAMAAVAKVKKDGQKAEPKPNKGGKKKEKNKPEPKTVAEEDVAVAASAKAKKDGKKAEPKPKEGAKPKKKGKKSAPKKGLPKGWTITIKKRKTGASAAAGVKDTYV